MKKFLLPFLLLFSINCISQTKELVSVWEKTTDGDHYKLEIYFDRSVETLMSANMMMNTDTSYFILEIAANNKFNFYRKSTGQKTMYAVLKEMDGEDRLYFNGGQHFLIKTYAKEEK